MSIWKDGVSFEFNDVYERIVEGDGMAVMSIMDIENLGDHDYEDAPYPPVVARDINISKFKTEYNV
jgi:hypothetical protein